MKALIARQIFGEEGFFIVMNDSDEIILKALSVMSNEEYTNVLEPAEE